MCKTGSILLFSYNMVKWCGVTKMDLCFDRYNLSSSTVNRQNCQGFRTGRSQDVYQILQAKRLNTVRLFLSEQVLLTRYFMTTKELCVRATESAFCALLAGFPDYFHSWVLHQTGSSPQNSFIVLQLMSPRLLSHWTGRSDPPAQP